jgi:hypothetical protein
MWVCPSWLTGACVLIERAVDVRRFDADIIPLEGAAGLLGRVGRLLDKAPTRLVDAREKREMLDDLVRIVRESEW